MRVTVPMAPAAWMAAGVLVAGSLDLAFAVGFWGIRGTPPARILQSIASGLLGGSAFQGGTHMAMLGAVLHYGMICAMAVGYFVASGYQAVLWRKPLVFGCVYGVVLYALMNGVVVPLSAAEPVPFMWSWILSSIVAHALLVGVPIALATRRARRPAR